MCLTGAHVFERQRESHPVLPVWPSVRGLGRAGGARTSGSGPRWICFGPDFCVVCGDDARHCFADRVTVNMSATTWAATRATAQFTTPSPIDCRHGACQRWSTGHAAVGTHADRNSSMTFWRDGLHWGHVYSYAAGRNVATYASGAVAREKFDRHPLDVLHLIEPAICIARCLQFLGMPRALAQHRPLCRRRFPA